MTAGSGILHQEMPKIGPERRIWGYQLWANLPALHKMMEPRYQDLKTSQIPEVKLPSGGTVRIVSGTVEGVSGPVKDIIIDPEYLDISIPSRTAFAHPVKPGHTVCTYILSGNGYFDPNQKTGKVSSENLVLYGQQGDRVEIVTEDTPLRFLLISGKPLGEPVAWYGPIVMNTQEELEIALEEFQARAFIKHKAK
jgi:redox-sensitive bicupin YhaK (pirin superfamily)